MEVKLLLVGRSFLNIRHISLIKDVEEVCDVSLLNESQIERLNKYVKEGILISDPSPICYSPCSAQLAGKPGKDGLSAFDVWKAQDPSRTNATEDDYLNSIEGEKGEKGDQGIQGPKGEKGDKGDPYVIEDVDYAATFLSMLNN